MRDRGFLRLRRRLGIRLRGCRFRGVFRIARFGLVRLGFGLEVGVSNRRADVHQRLFRLRVLAGFGALLRIGSAMRFGLFGSGFLLGRLGGLLRRIRCLQGDLLQFTGRRRLAHLAEQFCVRGTGLHRVLALRLDALLAHHGHVLAQIDALDGRVAIGAAVVAIERLQRVVALARRILGRHHQPHPDDLLAGIGWQQTGAIDVDARALVGGDVLPVGGMYLKRRGCGDEKRYGPAHVGVPKKGPETTRPQAHYKEMCVSPYRHPDRKLEGTTPADCASARDLPRAACGNHPGIASLCGIAYRRDAELGVLVHAAPIAWRSVAQHETG